jgi:hypothetical protein
MPFFILQAKEKSKKERVTNPFHPDFYIIRVFDLKRLQSPIVSWADRFWWALQNTSIVIINIW